MILIMFILFEVVVVYLMPRNPGAIAWFNQMDYGEQEFFIDGLITIVVIMCYLGIRRYTEPYQEDDLD